MDAAAFQKVHEPLRGGHRKPDRRPPALVDAAASSHVDMVRFLLAPGANPNDPNSWGQTPIVAAATRCSRAVDPAQVAPGQQEQFEVVHEQGRAGATLAIPDTAGLRPLAQRLASCCGHTPHSETQRRICEVFGL